MCHYLSYVKHSLTVYQSVDGWVSRGRMGGLERARIPFIVQSRPGFSAPKRAQLAELQLELVESLWRRAKRFGCASPGSTSPSSRLGGDVENLQVGMPLRALSQNRESRAGAMSSDASGECRTTSESFVRKNFSTDLSFSLHKHRRLSNCK